MSLKNRARLVRSGGCVREAVMATFRCMVVLLGAVVGAPFKFLRLEKNQPFPRYDDKEIALLLMLVCLELKYQTWICSSTPAFSLFLFRDAPQPPSRRGKLDWYSRPSHS